MDLVLGTTATGRPFHVPTDFLVQTCAILAIRGAGKTSTAAVIAEELSKQRLPWICFDPVGVWYGMRAARNGGPGGFPVVVIGGEHGDLPLERTAGGRIAEALISENVSAVIDLSCESKRYWHTFLTDFCLKLMELSPEIPRHLFIEEAPEFVPQRTRVELTARCKEAVDRLVRLGRNRGYGVTLISQRPATVDKDVLSQCENLFVLRTVGPHDRKALEEWIEAKASDKSLGKFLGEIASLPSGTAYFWSPHWLNLFEKVRIRERLTFHPGETRTVGGIRNVPALSDVGEFVERLKGQLAKTTKHQIERPFLSPKLPSGTVGADRPLDDYEQLQQEIRRLRGELEKGRVLQREMAAKLDTIKKVLQPQYDMLRVVFDAAGSGNSYASIDAAVYEPWLQKAGRRGCRRMLETVIERKDLTKNQLGTLAGVPASKSTFRAYMAWMKANGLIEVEGDTVRLRTV